MTPPLKPCPFCGSAPQSRQTLGNRWILACVSEDCHMRPYSVGESAAQADEFWNRRVDPVPSSVSSAIEEEANAARRRHEGRTT